MDRLVGVSRGGVSTSIAYDMGGRKSSMSDPDMGNWNYAYDALGNLTRQTDARGQRVLGNQVLVNGYAYYPWNQQDGRLHQMTSGTPGDLTSLQNLQYSYDPVGNVLSIQDYKMGIDANNPQSQSFAYDHMNRLL